MLIAPWYVMLIVGALSVVSPLYCSRLRVRPLPSSLLQIRFFLRAVVALVALDVVLVGGFLPPAAFRPPPPATLLRISRPIHLLRHPLGLQLRLCTLHDPGLPSSLSLSQGSWRIFGGPQGHKLENIPVPLLRLLPHHTTVTSDTPEAFMNTSSAESCLSAY
eukprot:6192564-Amphidinium_carterae.2